MLVGDGDTAVIGGIYTRNTGLAYTKVPFFADMPVIGWLLHATGRRTTSAPRCWCSSRPRSPTSAYLRCE